MANVATMVVALLAVSLAIVLPPFAYQGTVHSAMATGAENDNKMAVQQVASETTFSNHSSLDDVPDGYSLLTINATDTNSMFIRIGNVTVISGTSERSSENSEAQNTSRNNDNYNHPLTPKILLLKNNHRYDITVPNHWIYNGTYYIFDQWLGIGKNDEDRGGQDNGSGTTTTFTMPPDSSNNTTTITILTNPNKTANATITLTAAYQVVPITGEHFSDKIYQEFLTNNTVITLSEGERCCVPNGPVQIEKIYPDHVALKLFGFNIVKIITENATLHVGENITAGCGDSWVNLRLLKINDEDNTATFYKIYTVTGCPV